MRLVTFILGLLLGAAGAVAYMMFGMPARQPVVTAPLPKDPALTIVFGPGVVDQVIQRGAREAAAEASAHDVRTELRNGVIVVDGEVELLGQTSHASVELRPVLRAGQLRVDVAQPSVGALPVPVPALEQILERELDTRIHAMLDGMPVTLSGVQVDPVRGVTVTGEVDPAALDQAVSAAAR